MDFTDRVAKGVEFLNENGPAEWWDRVDYDVLSMDDGWACVLGQVFAAAADETGMTCGYIYALNTFDIDPQPLGFVSDSRRLREEWINAIENIRAEVNA